MNYRTPGRIVELAERVADANGLQTTSLRTVREGDHAPEITPVQESEILGAVVQAVEDEHRRLGRAWWPPSFPIV